MSAQELSNGVPDSGHLYAMVRAGRTLTPAGDLQETFSGMDQVTHRPGPPALAPDCRVPGELTPADRILQGKIPVIHLLPPTLHPPPPSLAGESHTRHGQILESTGMGAWGPACSCGFLRLR